MTVIGNNGALQETIKLRQFLPQFPWKSAQAGYFCYKRRKPFSEDKSQILLAGNYVFIQIASETNCFGKATN